MTRTELGKRHLPNISHNSGPEGHKVSTHFRGGKHASGDPFLRWIRVRILLRAPPHRVRPLRNLSPRLQFRDSRAVPLPLAPFDAAERRISANTEAAVEHRQTKRSYTFARLTLELGCYASRRVMRTAARAQVVHTEEQRVGKACLHRDDVVALIGEAGHPVIQQRYMSRWSTRRRTRRQRWVL